MNDTKQKWYMSSFTYGQKPEKIDRQAGALYGVNVVTEGEARGHGVNLDADFVRETIKQGNEKKQGLKSRFGHPNMSSTALGTFIGRVKNLRETTGPNGELIAKGDLFLSNSAKEAPQGDLFAYVLSLAEEDAKAFGMSIVFSPGKIFRKTDKGEKAYPQYEKTDDGLKLSKYIDKDGNDIGRDVNIIDRDYVECDELHATDLVDDPAANPDGVFSAFNDATIAGQVSEFLDLHPQVFELAKSRPEIIQIFFDRYETYNKEKAKMADAVINVSPEPALDAVQAECAAVVPTEQLSTATAAAAPVEPVPVMPVPAVADPVAAETETPHKDFKRMLEAFGAEIAAETFAAGGSFEDAQKKHFEKITSENAALKEKIKALESTPGTTPVSSNTEPKEKPKLFKNI
jgi:hypothetical protein